MGSDSEYEARMSATNPDRRISDRILGWLAWLCMRSYSLTLRWKIEGLDQVEPLLRANRPVIIATWHSRLLLFATLETRVLRKFKRTHPTVSISSNSRDGEIGAIATTHLGVQVIRGSTARKDRRKEKGGVAGARAALRALRSGAVVCMTIDGPRGPAEKVPVEPVKLAQQAGAPVIGLGLSSGGKRLRSWDRMIIPWPFARAAMVFAAPIDTDKSMDSEALRQRIERQLADATARADRLAWRPDATYPEPADEPVTSMETSGK